MLQLSLALLAPLCQEVDVVLKEGDVLPWGATVTTVNSAAAADTGDWVANLYIEALLDLNNVSVRNGELLFQESSSFGTIPGTTATGGGLVDIADDGKAVVFNTFEGVGSGCCELAIWMDPGLLLIAGDPVLAPSVPAGTTWSWFDHACVTARAEVALAAMLDVPGLDPLPALVRVHRVPGASLPQTQVLLQQGDLLPGLPSPVSSSSPLALGTSGDVLHRVRFGDSPQNIALFRNERLLAIQGGPTPIAGAQWDIGDGIVADMNDLGQVVFYGELAGSGQPLLVKEGQVLVAEQDVLPDLAPHPLHGISLQGSSPFVIGNTGQVLWSGSWNQTPTTPVRGLFLDDRLLVRTDAKTAGGAVIEHISMPHMSRGGRYVSFRGTLEGDVSALLRIDLLSSVTALSGCSGAFQASLDVDAGTPVVGTGLSFTLDGAQASGATGFVGVSTGGPIDPCGVVVPGVGEVLLGPAPVVWSAGTWSGSPLTVTLRVPDSLAMVGTVVRVQGAFLDPTPGAAEPVRLSGGLELRIGSY